jgi:hypothetical protein
MVLNQRYILILPSIKLVIFLLSASNQSNPQGCDSETLTGSTSQVVSLESVLVPLRSGAVVCAETQFNTRQRLVLFRNNIIFSIFNHYYAIRFLVISFLSAKIGLLECNTAFLVKWLPKVRTEFFSLQVILQVILFLTSKLVFYTHKCLLCVYVYVTGARIVLRQKQAALLTQ